jgi:hypothetical protein
MMLCADMHELQSRKSLTLLLAPTSYIVYITDTYKTVTLSFIPHTILPCAYALRSSPSAEKELW